MDLLSSATGPAEPLADPVAEVHRLRRQLQRERARRLAAESIGERATTDLYDSVRQLRATQAELLERADQARVVNDLARALRRDLDSGEVLTRTAESLGQATGADRCDVLLVDAHRYSAGQGTWSSSRNVARLPRPRSFVELPEALTTLLIEAAQRLEPLQIDQVVDDDERLGRSGAAEIREALGMRAIAAVPVSVGDEVVGWLFLGSTTPRAWQPRELAICQGVSHDLVTSLMQVHAFQQQRESVHRLEELDRAKDAFISTVSHELRTPLTSIVGYLELLADGGMGQLTEPVAEGVRIIERNVDRLRDLVEDLLTLSAYDAAQVRLDVRPLDVVRSVTRVVESLQATADARHVELVVAAEPGVPRALADATHIERVVQNLLGNAVKFSHSGGRVLVRVTRDDPSGSGPAMVTLRVSDTGIGIPAAEQERLFSRFFRSSLSVADEIQGTGLGLALVQTVVEWHEGTVEVDSTEGHGTTVTVRLPEAP